MTTLSLLFAAVVAFLALLGAIWGLGYGIFIVYAFVRAIVDRVNDKESAHYSKNVDR